MVADSEILLDQPVLSEDELHSEDEGKREHIYDTEYYMKLLKKRKELIQAGQMMIIASIVLAAPMLYGIWYKVKLPVPFCYTDGVFGYPLWSLVVVYAVVALSYTIFDYWKPKRMKY